MATELIEYKRGKAQSSLVRDGKIGSYDVLAKMIELVRGSVVLDKGLEDFFKTLMHSNGVTSHSNPSQILSLVYDYTKSSIAYIQDVAGATESIKDARTTLQDGFGDCDDLSVFIATWLAMIGLEPSFVLAKFSDEDAAPFNHVYVSVIAQGKRYVLDASLASGALNKEVSAASKDERGIFTYNEAVDGIGGTLRGVKGLVNETTKNGVHALAGLAGFLPIGLIPSSAISLGSALFSGANETAERSLSATASRISSILTDTIIELQNGRLALEVAQTRARDAMSKFYARLLRGNAEGADAETLERSLTQKYNYIENYGQVAGAPVAAGLNTNLMILAGVGVLGIGAYILFK